MDGNWTFGSCSWLWEDDAAVKNECIDPLWACDLDKACENTPTASFGEIDRPNKDSSIQHGTRTETLGGKRAALSLNASGISKRKIKKKSLAKSPTLGMPWTEDEHRRFLYGLTIHGKGKWKAIARDCVMTRNNAQVASHAQKHFQRIGGIKGKGKQAVTTSPPSTSPEKKSSNKETVMTGNKWDGSLDLNSNLPFPALEVLYLSGSND